MPDRQELILSLAGLAPADFEDVINTAFRQRGEQVGVDDTMPIVGVSRKQFAEWLARRHMSSDAAISKVIYLPMDAPDDEIRLLEVNRFLNSPDPDVVEPLDFTPDTDLPFKVFVADVTTDQWERIKQEAAKVLPPGWKLENNEIILRG